MNISKKMNLHQWAMDLKNQKESGLSVAAWAKINSIPENTLRYRFKQVELAMEQQINETAHNKSIATTHMAETTCTSEPVFAKVNLTTPKVISSGINIKLANVEVNIAPDTPNEHLQMVLEALAYAK